MSNNKEELIQYLKEHIWDSQVQTAMINFITHVLNTQGSTYEQVLAMELIRQGRDRC